MTDLDLRLVRYFVSVAEHEHFGRAAEALHIAQPSLSRQVRKLESDLGARLLDRTPQGSRLTEAGETFLPRARDLLRAAEQAVAQTKAAAQPSRLTVGYLTGIIVTPAVLAMRRQHPEAEVRAMHVSWQDPHAALLDHRVDVVIARLPFPTESLHVTLLYDEPRVVVVPVSHRLAGKEYVTIDDITDEPLPRLRGSHPTWSAFWRLEPRPDGRCAPDGPLIDDLEDKLEIIAAGEAIAISADIKAVLRPDITTIPLAGVEPSHVVLASRAGDRSRLVSSFARVARETLVGEAR